MKEEDLYKYCPKCGAKNLLKGKVDGLLCEKCDLEFFINPKPCCAAMIFNKNKKLLLTKRGINPYKGFWEFPGGFIKCGETAEEGLKRELKEELEIDLEVLENYKTESEIYTYKDRDFEVLDMFYICSFIGQPSPKDDVVDFGFFSAKDLPKIKPEHQKITDELIEKGRLL